MIECVQVCVFVIPDGTCVWNFVNGIKRQLGENRTVIGNAWEDGCFCGVGVVGEKEVEEILVSGGRTYSFGKVEGFGYFT